VNIIDKIEITGFWGDHRVEFNVRDDVNFLIGRNGSGKTTVINLVAAGLTADFQTLDRIQFETIIIRLKEIGGRKKPSIEIKKIESKNLPFPSISYLIKDSSKSKGIEFSLDDYEEQLAFRDYPHRITRNLQRHRSNSVLSLLREHVNVSWLSVNRSSIQYQRDEKNWESLVDKKLEELSNNLVRLFSQLSEKATILLEDFQKTVFLSLLSDKDAGQIGARLRKLDVAEERRSLEEIYSQFGLRASQYKNRTEKHFTSLEKGLKKFESSEPLTLDDLAALTGTVRIHAVVEDWIHLQEKRREIFSPKDTFIGILNSLVVRKSFFVNDRNELCVKTHYDKPFRLFQLSSGEKQLLIVLGEALLQEENPWIYIADEPELSLHVTWQESLVRNLKSINPNAQILFATHSPDIVSNYGNHVLDMEKELS
jgi:predicted ATP-binding protein involved in virulence